jgi:hypothetical protein
MFAGLYVPEYSKISSDCLSSHFDVPSLVASTEEWIMQDEMTDRAREYVREHADGAPMALLEQITQEFPGHSLTRKAVQHLRRRAGGRRVTNDASDVLPWALLPKHQMAHDALILRLVSRMRKRDETLSERDVARAGAVLRKLAEADKVVHYDPETGFQWVERRKINIGTEARPVWHVLDRDIIRDPYVDDQGQQIEQWEHRPPKHRSD